MLFQEITLAEPDNLNSSLYMRFLALSGTDRIRQTHHFGGRFENIYIELADIPQMGRVLEAMKQQAGKMLNMAMDELKAGFWFNAMQPGQRTLLHNHDENDELLSAVYYIRVPGNSGDLILHAGGSRIRVRPQEGKLVMFAPSMPHEVTEHLGCGLRLSVAMNVGPAGN